MDLVNFPRQRWNSGPITTKGLFRQPPLISTGKMEPDQLESPINYPCMRMRKKKLKIFSSLKFQCMQMQKRIENIFIFKLSSYALNTKTHFVRKL